ncbi:MAG: PAAR domain-containing protein [Deltaproteobacteria bacterium]|nr:PAAR domain-containing protein [Deltaproteobacteria bacterium]
MSAPPAEQGAAGWVAAGLGGVMGVIGAPQQIIDTAFAALTAPIAAMFPSMPAVTLLGMHVAPPHTHTHPPSFIPPAPPVPLPSLGMLVGAGSVTVLLSGLPAARAGDIGLAVTCGSLAPPFEVYTGSSNVFIGGSRAARILDMTKHCNPTSMGAVAAAMGAAGVAAGAAGAVATGNAWAGAQAAADAAVLALKMLAGKDPGLPPGMGVLMGPPVPNILIGGFPCPPVGEMAVQGLMRMLQSVARAARNFRNSRRGNAHTCDGTHPIYLITGENFDSYVDFVSDGMFRWERHYSSARQRLNGPVGYGNRHYYQRSLRVRLHKAIYTDWDGQEFRFPRFEKGSDVSKSNGYVLTRLRRGRYQIAYRDEPVMEFSGGEYDGSFPLKKLITKERELELGYDEKGRLVTFTEWQWEPRKETRYELRYDRDDRITDLYEMPFVAFGAPASSAPQPLLRAAYAYSRAGDLTDARDALGGKWKYELDWFHRLVKQTDPRGYSYTFKYDAQSRCVWASGEDGLWWAEVKYFPEKKKTVYTEGENATWEFLYDDDGFLHTLVDPYGGKTVRKRDDEGKVVEVIDSGGRVVRNLYDANGANVGRMDRFGYVYPTELEAPNLGNPFARDLPATPLARVFDGLVGSSPRAALGAMGSLLGMVPPEVASLAQATFRATAPGVPLLPEPRVERDALGRVIGETDSAGRRRAWQYDATGNVIGETDRDGRQLEQRTTSWNLVGERRSAVGARLAYRYSKLEQITAVIDPNDNVSRYDYDLKERLVRVSRMGKVREEYVFDGGDHLVAKKDSHGAILFENEIDPESHFVATRKLASGGEHRYRYDARGRIVEASTERHDVQLRHDGSGRRLSDVRDGVGVEHRLYGDGGRRSRVLGRFHTSSDGGSAGTEVLVGPSGSKSTLRFDEHGLVARQCANGTWELSQYDDQGRLEGRLAWKRASDGALQGWSVRYEWTAEGDLVRVLDSLRGTTVYRTDAAHRLISERTPEGQELFYELDLADNVLSKPAPGRQSLTRLEVTSGNRLVASDTEVFSYDHRDQLSTRQDRRTGRATHYVYDSFDMLVRLETRGPDGTELEPAWQYTYDALGRRTEVRRGGYRRQFYWDGDRLAAEVMPNGAVRVYEYAGDGALIPLAFTDYASADAAPESGKHYTVFTDPVGQPLQIEDAKGQLVWWASRVDPYGFIEIHPSSQLEYNLRWPGHYFDPETALHYNRYRYYDPALGRYLQTDPLGYEGSPTNLYGYPTNPLTDVDVLGLAHPATDSGATTTKTAADVDGAEGPVRPLDVDTYDGLNARAVVGDAIQHDHIPSFAAVRDAVNSDRAARGEPPLTPAQARVLKNNLNTIAMSDDAHAGSRTFRGRNTEAQRTTDAGNLRTAAQADTTVARQNLINEGHDPATVDAALGRLHDRNESAGVYDRPLPSSLWGGDDD